MRKITYSDIDSSSESNLKNETIYQEGTNLYVKGFYPDTNTPYYSQFFPSVIDNSSYNVFVTDGNSVSIRTKDDGMLFNVSNDAVNVGRQLNVFSNRIVNVAEPTDPQDAVNKQYVDGFVTIATTEIASKVTRAGDTMTGYLSLYDDPTESLHAATKSYVDTKFTEAKEWIVVANTTVSNTAIPIPSQFATVADWLANVDEGMIVVKDGNEYVATTIAAKAVLGFPAIFPLHKGGTHLAEFRFQSPTDTTFGVIISNANNVTVLMR